MKTGIKLAINILFAFICINANADTPDPLWSKTVQHLQKAQKYVARDIEQKLEAEKDGVKKQATMKAQISSWKDNTPVYSILSVEPKPKDGANLKAIDFEAMMKGVNRLMCDDQTSVKRSNGQKIEGVDAVLFEIDEGSVQKINAKIWVQPETGEVYRYQIRVSVPLAVEFDTQVRFDDTPNGVRLGVMRETEFASKIPFKKAKGHLLENLSNWVLRPQ